MFRKLLFLSFFLFPFSAFSQSQTDTIRSGNYYGYGKSVNGKKEGTWNYFYADSNYPFAEGAYYSGMKTGEWKFYFNHSLKQKKTKRVMHYSQNLPDGPVFFYYVDGSSLARGQYNKGYVDGKWEYFDEDGDEITSVHYFTMGKATGTWICASGGKRMYWTGEMKNGDHYGRWKQFQNGTQVGTGLYVNGKREGNWMEFTGNFIYEEGNYKAGKKEGYWITSDIDEGKIKSQVFHNDIQDGPDSVFSQGRLTEITYYKNGFINGSYESYNEDGSLKSKGTLQTNSEFISFMNCRERIFPFVVSEIFLLDYVETGLVGRTEIFFSSDLETNTLHRDTMMRKIRNSPIAFDTCNYQEYPLWEYRKSGNWQYFYPNGKIKCEGAYSLIPKDSVSWDSTNMVENPNNPGIFISAPIKFETAISAYEGWWKIYNEKGILIREEWYEYGELKEVKK